LQRIVLLLFSLRVWLRLAMAASAAEMPTAETAAEMSTAEAAAESTGVRYAKPVMEPSTAKTVMIKVSFMIEAVMPVTPQAAVVVPVGRVAIRSVIARPSTHPAKPIIETNSIANRIGFSFIAPMRRQHRSVR
jgi:hypothetical protein